MESGGFPHLIGEPVKNYRLPTMLSTQNARTVGVKRATTIPAFNRQKPKVSKGLKQNSLQIKGKGGKVPLGHPGGVLFLS
jgi:hypothetical protein